MGAHGRAGVPLSGPWETGLVWSKVSSPSPSAVPSIRGLWDDACTIPVCTGWPGLPDRLGKELGWATVGAGGREAGPRRAGRQEPCLESLGGAGASRERSHLAVRGRAGAHPSPRRQGGGPWGELWSRPADVAQLMAGWRGVRVCGGLWGRTSWVGAGRGASYCQE